MAVFYAHLFAFIILFGGCSGHMDTEPKCSQFGFQDQILEKMVRMEHSSELLRAELANANDEIRRTKEELSRLKGTAPTINDMYVVNRLNVFFYLFFVIRT